MQCYQGDQSQLCVASMHSYILWKVHVRVWGRAQGRAQGRVQGRAQGRVQGRVWRRALRRALRRLHVYIKATPELGCRFDAEAWIGCKTQNPILIWKADVVVACLRPWSCICTTLHLHLVEHLDLIQGKIKSHIIHIPCIRGEAGKIGLKTVKRSSQNAPDRRVW